MRHYSSGHESWVALSGFLAAAAVFGLPRLSLADAPAKPARQAAASAYVPCNDRPAIDYQLGPKSDIDALYPMIKTPSMSEYDYSMAVAASIQFYLQHSLTRDQIGDACALTVTPAGEAGYNVSFRSSDPRATGYRTTQSSWLKHGKLALQGVQNCQKNESCWEPKGEKLACSGPWQFYLPLGLPMVSQKMVMLLHYPPYTAMQQSDYLNNATLDRWRRLLVTVGVPASDWTLYTTTVDIFPIAAPGSGQTGCFPPISATNFFGDKGSGYIPAMLNALTIPPAAATAKKNTVPVIIYGQEAIGYWNSTYPRAQTGVNVAGSVRLGDSTPRMTPYMGANHPIAAVYQNCSSKPGGGTASKQDIETIVKQDLTTACFARSMAAAPDADPGTIAAQCKASYFDKPDLTRASQICVTAVIDKSPQFAQWTTEQAKAWCDKHDNATCPLPDYSSAK